MIVESIVASAVGAGSAKFLSHNPGARKVVLATIAATGIAGTGFVANQQINKRFDHDLLNGIPGVGGSGIAGKFAVGAAGVGAVVIGTALLMRGGMSLSVEQTQRATLFVAMGATGGALAAYHVD